ncbi:hypothetical protein ABW19_dt0208398 [Dactylella cylindrospora]|nr:hypothetical protein ABW19_dt0208398 [Dactylella cylindrospora]
MGFGGMDIFNTFLTVGGLAGMIPGIVIPMQMAAEGPPPEEASWVYIVVGTTGNSDGKVRLDNGEELSIGGSLPTVTLWKENGTMVAFSGRLLDKRIEDTNEAKYTIEHLPENGFLTPSYIAVGPNKNDDELCLYRVIVSAPTGKELHWPASLGKFCGAPWYPTAQRPEEEWDPVCIWFGGNQTIRQLQLKIDDMLVNRNRELTQARLIQFYENPGMICDSVPRMGFITNPMELAYASGLTIYEKEIKKSREEYDLNPQDTIGVRGKQIRDHVTPHEWYPYGPFEDLGNHLQSGQPDLPDVPSKYRWMDYRGSVHVDYSEFPWYTMDYNTSSLLHPDWLLRRGLNSQYKPKPESDHNPTRNSQLEYFVNTIRQWDPIFYDGRDENTKEEHKYLNDISRIKGYDRYQGVQSDIQRIKEEVERQRLQSLGRGPAPKPWELDPIYSSSFGKVAKVEIGENAQQQEQSEAGYKKRRVKRSFNQPPPVDPKNYMPGRLVKSHNKRHSAKEVCESSTSRGPDFISLHEELYCDMETKHLWELCSKTITEDCFDLKTHKVRFRGNQKRDLGGRTSSEKNYKNVEEWNKPTSRVVSYSKWAGWNLLVWTLRFTLLAFITGAILIVRRIIWILVQVVGRLVSGVKKRLVNIPTRIAAPAPAVSPIAEYL